MNLKSLKLAGIICLVIIALLIPVFVSSPYYMGIFIMTGINIILAMTFILMFRTGIINLSISAFWAVGAYTSVILVMRGNWSYWLSMPAAMFLTGIVALMIGYFLMRNSGFTFVILSSVIGMLVPVILGNTEYFGSRLGISNVPPPDPVRLPFLPAIEFTSKVPFYYLMLLLLFLIILLFAGFYASRTGRAWLSIGLNTKLAESLGVNVFKYRLIAFVLASMVCGLTGSFYAHYITTVTPGAFSLFKTFNATIYAILGGIDFAILGPVIGAFLMTFFPEFLRITKEIEPIFTGLLLILLIIFLPGGLLSLFNLRPVLTKLRIVTIRKKS